MNIIVVVKAQLLTKQPTNHWNPLSLKNTIAWEFFQTPTFSYSLFFLIVRLICTLKLKIILYVFDDACL